MQDIKAPVVGGLQDVFAFLLPHVLLGGPVPFSPSSVFPTVLV